MQAVELGAGVGRAHRRGDAVALAAEEARQQVADAAVVVDQQQMRRVVGGCGGVRRDGGCVAHVFSFAVALELERIFSSTLSGSSRSIIARRNWRTVSVPAGPMPAIARLMRSVCSPASFATSASPLAVANSRRCRRSLLPVFCTI